jgi:peroxiredoxin
MKSLIATILMSAAIASAAEVGKPAPAFDVKDAKGASVSMADLKGKVVVVEWNNFGCPFVEKHYSTGNMQKLQETYTGKDVVWLTVAAGSDTAAALSKAEENKWKGSHYILDSDGALKKDFGAKTTPHMFVIDKKGDLVYNGALDSKATTDKDDLSSAENYVAVAVDAALEGKPVTKSKTEPYGCAAK